MEADQILQLFGNPKAKAEEGLEINVKLAVAVPIAKIQLGGWVVADHVRCAIQVVV